MQGHNTALQGTFMLFFIKFASHSFVAFTFTILQMKSKLHYMITALCCWETQLALKVCQGHFTQRAEVYYLWSMVSKRVRSIPPTVPQLLHVSEMSCLHAVTVQLLSTDIPNDPTLKGLVKCCIALN